MSPTATFPHSPEPNVRNMRGLASVVKSVGADVGFLVNADADRVGVVAEGGVALSEEYVFPLIADYQLESAAGPVVTDAVDLPHGGKRRPETRATRGACAHRRRLCGAAGDARTRRRRRGRERGRCGPALDALVRRLRRHRPAPGMPVPQGCARFRTGGAAPAAAHAEGDGAQLRRARVSHHRVLPGEIPRPVRPISRTASGWTGRTPGCTCARAIPSR